MLSTDHMGVIYKKIRFGQTVFRLPRSYVADRIMDDFNMEQALIHILVDNKGRVSRRRIGRKFRDATGTNVSDGTLVGKLQELKCLVKRRRYKPKLTETHEWTRYFFGARHHKERYHAWIDIDEKWFYVVRVKGWVWILPDYMDEKQLKRLPVQSKRYITKVMFLTAVARPIFAQDGTCIFNGKVGNWRVAELRRYAQQYHGKFVHHEAGDPYMKDVNLDAECYCKILRAKLLPRIRELRRTVWDPFFRNRDYEVRVQHDGAPGHRADGIEAYLESIFAAVNVRFIRQPAKSPCCNLLDMCVFNVLAARVAQCDYDSKEELIAAVKEAWLSLNPTTLSKCWASKCITMRRFIDNNGREIDAAHVGLTSAFREGGLPELWREVDRYCAVSHAPESNKK